MELHCHASARCFFSVGCAARDEGLAGGRAHAPGRMARGRRLHGVVFHGEQGAVAGRQDQRSCLRRARWLSPPPLSQASIFCDRQASSRRKTCMPPTLRGFDLPRGRRIPWCRRQGAAARRAGGWLASLSLILLFSPRFSECRSPLRACRSCSCSRIGGCRRPQRTWNFA